MRVMVIVKATRNSEAGLMPGDPGAPAGYEKLLEQMGAFNEELVKAGVMLAGEGLTPSARGKRVVFADGTRRTVDGPFAETKEIVAGFWLWQVKDMDEAMAWADRCPAPMPGEESVIELRPVYESTDFPPDVAAHDEHLRAELERQRS